MLVMASFWYMPLTNLRSRRARRKQGGKMTEFVIKLRDDSKASLLLATLKRLVTSQGVDLAIEQNGQGIALDAAPDDDARFDAMVDQIIADAMAGKLRPLTAEEMRELDEYGEKVGAELNFSDDDIVRLVKETRAEPRAQSVA